MAVGQQALEGPVTSAIGGHPRVTATTKNRQIGVFLALTFLWSWGVGWAGSAITLSSPGWSSLLLILSGFGPTLAAIAVVALFGGRARFRSWLSRCLEWRIGWRWFGLAFLAPPVLMVGALMLHVAMGGTLPSFPASEKIPLAIANFGLVMLIGGPLGEEFGWRGYLMPSLASRLHWRTASLVAGLIWGFWHLPLFFMVGTPQAQMPIPVFLLNILAGSVLFGWLQQQTRQSVLPAIVLHTSLNAWAGVLRIVPTPQSQGPYLLVTVLLAVAAVFVLIKPDRQGVLSPT